jgi:hypothetical protein
MNEFPVVTPGTIITYLDLRAGTAFRRAVVCGSAIPDPGTNEAWFPARHTDAGSTLIDPCLVVDVTPADSPVAMSQADDPLVVLGGALHAIAHELAEPEDDGSKIGQRTRQLIVEFLDVIDPIRPALHARAKPISRLAVVLGYVRNAAAHLDAGDIAAARAAVLTAETAMGAVLADDPD